MYPLKIFDKLIKVNLIKFYIKTRIDFNDNLVELATELSSINETSTTTGGVTQDGVASRASDNSLSVTVDSRNLVTSLTFNVHEEGVGALNEALLLVLKLLSGEGRIQQISDQLKVET